MGAFEAAGDALLGGVEVVLPSGSALHFDQDVEAQSFVWTHWQPRGRIPVPSRGSKKSLYPRCGQCNISGQILQTRHRQVLDDG